MAKHIRIGEPVNEAERWAFTYLAEHLPEPYILITNLEVLAQSGQPLEVDALVIGEFAVYLVDVKGYTGRLEAGVNDWTLDSQWVANALSKANYVARVLAGRIGARVPKGIHAPWCQGMILATGREGRHIEIVRDVEELCVFTPSEILAALTKESYLTSRFNSPITEQQKDYALEVIGRVSVMASRQNRVQDFEKIKLLGKAGSIEIWESKYSVGEWESSWFLKILRASQADNPEHFALQAAEVRDEFYRLQQLSGISGVPSCAPLINDGEQLVLPIKRPRGVPLSIFDLSRLEEAESIQFLRRALTSIQQIHARGCTIGSINENNVFLSNEGDLEFLDIRNDFSIERDISNFREVFYSLSRATRATLLIDWFEDDQKNSEEDLLKLGHYLDSGFSGVTEDYAADFEISVGSLVAGRYELELQISNKDNVESWKAKHIAGQFYCGVSIHRRAGEYWPYVSEQYSLLINLYHPSLERVFDFGVIEKSDIYYISRAWADGETLSAARECSDSDQMVFWLKSLLTALQYLHSHELVHRNITPDNILCSDSGVILVNYSAFPSELRFAEDMRYSDPYVVDAGWSHESDIYSLIVSFFSIGPGFEHSFPMLIAPELHSWLESTFGSKFAAASERFLSQRGTLDRRQNYLAYFGLEDTSERLGELPEEFKKKWGISKGYMTFLVLDMVNDQTPRSRNQFVLNALRTRQIPGNKTNRSSMNATISRLKSAGIAEDYGKKVRLTRPFLESLVDVQ